MIIDILNIDKINCPHSYGFDEPRECQTVTCMAFRLLPFNMKEPGFIEAVQEHAKATGDKSNGFANSVKYVHENRAEFGLPTQPTHGYCGESGKPEHLKVFTLEETDEV